MAEQLTKVEICGFCFLETRELHDPRRMVCGHPYCMPCLKFQNFPKFQNPELVECSVKECSGSCPHVEVDNLPRVMETSVTRAATTSVCDCQGCEEVKAVSYCIDCGRKLCALHNEHHPAYFAEKHQIIEISKYEESPEDFKQPVCEDHKVKLQLACDVCEKLVCLECDVMEKNCQGEDKNHTLKEFGTFERDLRELYTVMIWAAAAREALICKEEKKAWTQHDATLDTYVKMIDDVDRRTEEQLVEQQSPPSLAIFVRNIRQQAEEMKDQIQQAKEAATLKAVDFASEMMNMREEIKLLRVKVTRLLEECHVTEKIRQREVRAREMTEVLLKDVKTVDIQNKYAIIMSTDQSADLTFSMTAIPTSLKFVSRHDTKSGCLFVAHLQSGGDLLVGCEGHLKLLKSGADELTELLEKPTIVAREYEGEVFLQYDAGGAIVILEKYSISSKASEAVHSFKRELSENPSILFSINSQYTATVRTFYSNEINIYNRATKLYTTRSLEGLDITVQPHLQSDGTLLVSGATDPKQSKVNKYRLREETDEDPVLIWSCDLPQAFGLTLTECGLIYVTGVSNKTIYILGQEGVILRQMKNDDLPKRCFDISIRGDELAVAGGVENCVTLFKLSTV